jgi:hypothetical protein
VGGIFLDGWAHAHGRVDESLFTPWHAVLAGIAGLLLSYLLLPPRIPAEGSTTDREIHDLLA